MESTLPPVIGRVRTTTSDRIVLGFAFLIPLLPPPTAAGPERFATPVMMALGVVYLTAAISLRHPLFDWASSSVPRLAGWMGSVLAIYLGRMVIQGAWGDTPYLASRGLLIASLIVTVRWLELTKTTVARVMRSFALGYLTLAVFILAVGVSKWDVLGIPRPSRGWPGSLAKTTGWPRSAGEVGIMASIALAFFLVYRRSLPRWLSWTGPILIGLSLLVVQSRNVLLASLMIVFAYLVITLGPVRIAGIVVVIAFLSPLIAEALVPTLESTHLGTELVGDASHASLRRNVYKRFELIDMGLDLLLTDPLQSVVGHSRKEWSQRSAEEFGEEAAIHNHFLAGAVNLGLVGAGISFGILFIQPIWRMLRRRQPSAALGAVFLATLGTIVSLSFYEGFFSPSLMLIWALMYHVAFPPIPSAFEAVGPGPVGQGTTGDPAPGKREEPS